MPDYQIKRVGFVQSFVVTFSWLDFAGDVSWTHQRYHAWARGDEPYGGYFALAAMVIIVGTTIVTGVALSRNVISKHKNEFVKKKVNGAAFTTLLILAATNPDVMSYFPWTKEAYTMEVGSLPNQDVIHVSFMKLFEDVPQFVLQVVYLIVWEYDEFTVLNIALTLVMLFYLVMGKLQKLYFRTEEGTNGTRKSFHGMIEMIQRPSFRSHSFAGYDNSRDTSSMIGCQHQGSNECDLELNQMGKQYLYL